MSLSFCINWVIQKIINSTHLWNDFFFFFEFKHKMLKYVYIYVSGFECINQFIIGEYLAKCDLCETDCKSIVEDF